jgi:predicted nucleic acid-binding protein
VRLVIDTNVLISALLSNVSLPVQRGRDITIDYGLDFAS